MSMYKTVKLSDGVAQLLKTIQPNRSYSDTILLVISEYMQTHVITDEKFQQIMFDLERREAITISNRNVSETMNFSRVAKQVHMMLIDPYTDEMKIYNTIQVMIRALSHFEENPLQDLLNAYTPEKIKETKEYLRNLKAQNFITYKAIINNPDLFLLEEMRKKQGSINTQAEVIKINFI